jgi:hypothetical protein
MPAFKSKLSEDETWHLVNYVRRLRNLAGDAIAAGTGTESPPADAPAAAPGATPQPPSPSASGDAEALDLLRRSDEAMNALTSLVEDQTLRDDAGNQLSVRFEYNAPDRMRYQIANGATSIQIGVDDYQLGPDGEWIKNQRAPPLQWPIQNYAQAAGGAKFDTGEQGQIPGTKIVAFNYEGVDFRAWIDLTSYYLVQLAMDAPNHHMLTVHSSFNSAPEIEPPIP